MDIFGEQHRLERMLKERDVEIGRLKTENEELRVLARQLSDAACFGAHHPKDDK